MSRLKLYNLDPCPYCQMVRQKLDELQLAYEKIDVPFAHHERTEVLEVSGQPRVPVLVDGSVVLDDEDRIIDYLESTYRKQEEKQ